MPFRYLGINVTINGIRLYKWNDQHLGNKAEVRTYKTLVRPIVTYTAETRADRSKTENILEVSEIVVLNLVTKTMRDIIRSENKRKPRNVKKIGISITKRRVEWNNHTSRMATNKIVRSS